MWHKQKRLWSIIYSRKGNEEWISSTFPSITPMPRASPLARSCPVGVWLTRKPEYFSSQHYASFCRNIQVYILVRMIGHRARGKLSVEEASSSWVVEGASSLAEVASEVAACSLEDKVASSLVEEVVPGSRWEHRMAGIAAWEASVALVVEGAGVVEGCSTSVNRLDSKP